MSIKTFIGDAGCSIGRGTGQCLWAKGFTLPQPTNLILPTSTIQPCGIILRQQAKAILSTIDNKPIYLPDATVAIYDKNAVAAFLDLNPVSEITYLPDDHDCDDFAAELYFLFAGLVWTDTHALNWFIDENLKFWYIEPQNDTIADKLLDWQGNRIQFFLSRR